MKKSQVLAALALAFALGVVAPVASVVNSADTYAVDYDPARQASYCDVMNGVSAVRGVDAYVRFEKVYVSAFAYNDTDTKVFYTPANAVASLTKNQTLKAVSKATIISDLQTAIDAVPSVSHVSGTISGLKTEAEEIHFTNVNKGDFAKYAELFDYMTMSDADLAGKESQFIGVIRGIADFNENGNWSPAQIKSFVLDAAGGAKDAAGNGWSRSNEYITLAPVIAAYKNALVYDQATSEYATALKGLVGLGNVVLTTRDVTDIVENAANPLYSLDDLAKNATKVNGFGYFDMYAADKAGQNNPTASAGYAKLIYLTNYAADHAQLREGGVNDGNRDMLDRIGNAYDAAVALVPGSAAQYRNFKALMAAYTGTCGTTSNDGSNNNGGTGDDQNKPTEGDNKAPNTGALANAEGSASTTVAMVAGIATALTAAGAGVVAYRNARRSTRK